MGILDYITMLLLKNGFLEKIETWHVGLSCQFTHFMSFSIKSEHDTVADQATLRVQTVAKRHMRSSMFTASFILVSRVKLP